jgi:hypothetical protein
MTAPFVVAALVATIRFREPRLHPSQEAEPLRRQVAATYRTLLERGALRPVVALTVLTALVLQMMLEFGPLWMVALAAPAALFGPHWAGLMGALGVGGLLGGRLALSQPGVVAGFGALLVGCSVILTESHLTAVVIAAQVVLVLVVVAIGIPVTKQLHDAIPSTMRAGVASGVGTLTWLTFLPSALLFGAISDRRGVHDAGWTVVAIACAAAVLLASNARSSTPAALAVPVTPAFAPDRFLPADDRQWPGHWARPPAAWDELPRIALDSPDTLAAVRAAIADLPSRHRDVIVMRDIDRHTPAEVCETLGLGGDEERQLLNQARGHVRGRLDRLLTEGGM